VTSSDAPQPPGGPLREDQPDGPMAPASDATHGEDQDETQDDAQRDLQEENAETSLDQPSS
jgi:hypothetical protein